MLVAGNQSPRRWIQAILIANDRGLELDAGTVSLPIAAPADSFTFFGDAGYSWVKRGANREFIPGSILNVSITRPSVAAIIQTLKNRGQRISPFVKAVIRQHIQTGPNQLPDPNDAANILILNGAESSEQKAEKPHKIPKTYKTERYRLYHPEEAEHGQTQKKKGKQQRSQPQKNPLLDYINKK